MKIFSLKTIAIIFSVFISLFGLIFIGVNSKNLWRSFSAVDWPTTNGEVTASEIYRLPQVKLSYAPRVQYSYTVNNTNYNSNRIHFSHMVGGKDSSQAIASRYPVGSNVIVYYSPQNPADSVLDKSVKYKENLMGLFFGLVFIGAGIILYIFSRRILFELRR